MCTISKHFLKPYKLITNLMVKEMSFSASTVTGKKVLSNCELLHIYTVDYDNDEASKEEVGERIRVHNDESQVI